MIEIFIFDGNGTLFDVVGDVGKADWSPLVVRVNFVKKLAVTVENLSADRGGSFGKFGGIGNVFKKKNKSDKNEPRKNGNN